MSSLLIPDILANAGGLVVSYFEWVQGPTEFRQDRGEVGIIVQRSRQHRSCTRCIEITGFCRNRQVRGLIEAVHNGR